MNILKEREKKKRKWLSLFNLQCHSPFNHVLFSHQICRSVGVRYPIQSFTRINHNFSKVQPLKPPCQYQSLEQQAFFKHIRRQRNSKKKKKEKSLRGETFLPQNKSPTEVNSGRLNTEVTRASGTKLALRKHRH